MTYADTTLLDIGKNGGHIDVQAEGWDESELNLRFNCANLIKDLDDGPERVEYSQLIKLKNGRRRLILFDDEKTIFFEIEYEDCERNK